MGGRQFAALAQGAHTLRELTQYPWIGLRRGTQTHAWHTQLFLREQLIYCPDVEAATAAQLRSMSPSGARERDATTRHTQMSCSMRWTGTRWWW